MIYASTKDTIKKAFTGLSLEFQANDAGDFDYDSLCGEVEKKAWISKLTDHIIIIILVEFEWQYFHFEI